MAKTKVIKFVYQGYRTLKPNEYYMWGGELTKWFGTFDSSEAFEVYHKFVMEEEVPRWRAENGGVYYRANVFLQIVAVTENLSILDNVAFDSGNYFQTEKQAREYIDYCNKFFENN